MKSPEQIGKMPEPLKEKGKEKELDNEEQDLVVTLSKNATFADLFNAIESNEESEELGDIFEQELEHNFGPEILDEVLSFEDVENDKAGTTKIIDFFKEHGYSQSEISTSLPIEFK